jgi:hypothetical protein
MSTSKFIPGDIVEILPIDSVVAVLPRLTGRGGYNTYAKYSDMKYKTGMIVRSAQVVENIVAHDVETKDNTYSFFKEKYLKLIKKSSLREPKFQLSEQVKLKDITPDKLNLKTDTGEIFQIILEKTVFLYNVNFFDEETKSKRPMILPEFELDHLVLLTPKTDQTFRDILRDV